jgi:hypothetical protein
MKIYYVLLGALLVFNLEGCTSAEDKKNEAQAEYTEEKTETLREYKECVKEAEGVEAKLAQCEALLKAVGVMEGGTVQSSVPAAAPAAPAETAPATE